MLSPSLLLSSRIPSNSPIHDFDLVVLDGNLLLVCVDFHSDVLTWDPLADRWNKYRLDKPWRPRDEYDFIDVLSISAAVVNGRVVVGGGGPHQGFTQWDLETGAVRTFARTRHGAVATTATVELDGRPLFASGDSSAFPAYLRLWDPSHCDPDDDTAP